MKQESAPESWGEIKWGENPRKIKKKGCPSAYLAEGRKKKMTKTTTTLTPVARAIAEANPRDGFYHLAYAILEPALKDYKQESKQTDKQAKATVREVEEFINSPLARLCYLLLERGDREISLEDRDYEASLGAMLDRIKSEL